MKGPGMHSLSSRLAKGLKRSRFALFSILTPLLAFSFFDAVDSVKRFAFIVLGFSLIIFLHELGHFLVARACSVKCLAFSIGIGPRMLGWRKGTRMTFGKDPYEPDTKDPAAKVAQEAEGTAALADLPQSASAPRHAAGVGDCDYRVSWLPLGGYVRMLGQDDMDPTKVSADPRAFNMRPIWQRMCIVSAGVIMNIIFAAVTFSIIFSHSIGVNFPPARIGAVAYDSPAYKAGLKMGDEITAIDGKRDLGFVEFTDVQIACALSSGTEPINFTWNRPTADGGVTSMSAGMTPIRPADGGFLMIGVTPMPSLNIANSKELLQDYVDQRKKPLSEGGFNLPAEAAELAKLRMHDRIVTLDGQPVADYADFYHRLQTLGNKPMTITVHNADPSIADRTLTILPHFELTPGVVPGGESFPTVAGMRPRLIAQAVVPGSGAAAAGMKAGDVITLMGDRTDPSYHDVFQIAGDAKDRPDLPVRVLRNGETKLLSVKVSKEGKIGIAPHEDLESSAVVVADRSVAPQLSIFDHGDDVRIAAVDGQAVKSWIDVYGLLKAKAAGDKVNLTFSTGAASASASAPATEAAAAPVTANTTITLSEDLVKTLHEHTHYIANLPVENETRTQRADSVGGAVIMGAQHTRKFILQVYMTLAGLFRGTVSPTNLHGIVGITKIGYDIQERGHVWLWYVLAMVSVNLAVANFLPLPIVDGGLFLLLILEKIRGKPLSLKVQSAIQIVGIVLLAGLFIFVTYNDIGLIIHGK